MIGIMTIRYSLSNFSMIFINKTLTTYKDLHHTLRKARHKENINIRPLMDWELKMLEDNMIQYRRDGKNIPKG